MKRVPLGLTIATLLAFILLAGLGVWQLHRLAWKRDLLARIEALNHASAQPIEAVVARPHFDEAAEFVRVSARCAPGADPAAVAYRYALRDGAVGWRLLTVCRLTAGPYDGVLLDRGLVRRFTGAHHRQRRRGQRRKRLVRRACSPPPCRRTFPTTISSTP